MYYHVVESRKCTTPLDRVWICCTCRVPLHQALSPLASSWLACHSSGLPTAFSGHRCPASQATGLKTCKDEVFSPFWGQQGAEQSPCLLPLHREGLWFMPQRFEKTFSRSYRNGCRCRGGGAHRRPPRPRLLLLRIPPLGVGQARPGRCAPVFLLRPSSHLSLRAAAAPLRWLRVVAAIAQAWAWQQGSKPALLSRVLPPILPPSVRASLPIVTLSWLFPCLVPSFCLSSLSSLFQSLESSTSRAPLCSLTICLSSSQLRLTRLILVSSPPFKS